MRAEIIGLAAEEWIKRVTLAAEKYAVHAGRKTVKPEDIAVVVKDMGINIQIPQSKPKPKIKKIIAAVTPVSPPPKPPMPPSPVPVPIVNTNPVI